MPSMVYSWSNIDCDNQSYGEVKPQGSACSDCVREDITYFLREPTQVDDGFTYTKFTYPHPLVTGEAEEDLTHIGITGNVTIN